MKKLVMLMLLLVSANVSADAQELEQSFSNPPASARPWVYWWWNGRVSKESITRDLEGLKAKGIGGMLLFHCDDGILPDAVFGKTKAPWSPEWEGMVGYAGTEAKRLGLGFIVNYTASSTGAGGPWIAAVVSGNDRQRVQDCVSRLAVAGWPDRHCRASLASPR